MTWAERLAVAPLLAGMIFIGVYPQPLLNRIQPSVNHLVAAHRVRRPRASSSSLQGVATAFTPCLPTRSSTCPLRAPSTGPPSAGGGR